MGKIQKIKEQRKLEKEEQVIKNKKRKDRLLSVFGVLVVIGLVGVIGYKGTRAGNTNNQDNNKSEVKTMTEKIGILETNLGTIKFKLFSDAAPKTVENFQTLASNGFYDGVKFHRVIKDFMVQTGDPNSKDDDWTNDGMGGPGYTFQDEINDYKLIRGRVAMANSGVDTNGSQFFIVTKESTPWLDGKHTVFGEVIEGMDVVDKIEAASTNENDHPLEDIVINKALVEEK